MKLGPLAVARGVALGVVLTRVARAARTRPPIAAASPTPDTSISIVIPARSEADRIGPLLDPLVGAPSVGEVIVVDDESTDSTAALAAGSGAHVVGAGARPPGWSGKAWALQRGVDAASGEWIVTFDADTRPDPALPGALVARADADRTDLLTVAGRFVGDSAGARWLHASMLATLVYRFGPPGQKSSPTPTRLLANGQCMVFRRADLLASGGFAPVAGHVVEDVALARHLAAGGRRVDFLDAGRLLDVELYGSLGATWSGWGRSIGLPGVERRLLRLTDVGVLALTLPLPTLRLMSGRADVIDAIALVARLGTLVGARSAFARTDLAYWLSPFADAIAVAALAKCAVATTQTWRGRTYTI